MKIVKSLAALAAVGMLAAQPVAAANPAAKLSLKNIKSDVRASAKAGKSKQFGLPVAAVILGAVAITTLVVVLVDDSDSN